MKIITRRNKNELVTINIIDNVIKKQYSKKKDRCNKNYYASNHFYALTIIFITHIVSAYS